MALSRVLRAARPLDAGAYQPHPLHREDRAFSETNCYTDLFIEVLHTLDLDPHALLGFTFGLDFEGDQFTFFKPPPGDLQALYGLDVQELSIWRPLVDQVVEQAGRGRLVLPEVDAYFLPDTRGTDYRSRHTKTTIAIHEIDPEERRLGYFHNGGYHALFGDDFAGLFRMNGAPAEALPPYVEFVKLDSLMRWQPRELVALSIELLRGRLVRLPSENPILRFLDRFRTDLEWLIRPGADFHGFAFVTLRQLGSCFELAGSYVRWLIANGEDAAIERAATECEAIASGTKTLLLKTARAANARKPFDPAPLLGAMATSWTAAMDCLRARYSM